MEQRPMRGVLLILLIVYGCFGCANQSNYPSYWDYQGPDDVMCHKGESKICTKYGTKLICECKIV